MGYNVTKDDENGELDELVDLIDRLMDGGDGHISITSDELAEGVKIDTYRSNDCGTSKGACCQPTEQLEDED